MSASAPNRAVLIVDDDPGIRSSLERILKHDGYHVDLAGSAAQAMDRENWQDYFAILLDRHLPDGSADDLISQMVECAPESSVLVITGFADLESSLAAIRDGAADYLLKPVDPDALRVRLHSLADLWTARRELCKRDQQIRFMIEHLPAGAAYIDNESGTMLINPAIERMTGYSPADLPDRDAWFREAFRSHADEHRSQYEQDRNGGFSEPRILKLLTKDGRELLIDFNAYQYDEHEVWLMHDVTEHMRVQAELQQQRDFSDRILQTAPVIVLLLDRDARIVKINEFMQDLSGYQQEEVVGQNWFEMFIPEDDGHRIRSLFQRVVDGEDVRGHINAIRPRDGRDRQIAWWAKALHDAEGNVTEVLSIGHDITNLQEIQDKLVQSERLAAIGQMIAGLAHESRNALQRARACLDMLSLDLSDQPKQVELTGRIETALNELQRLYEEVRNYAAPVRLSLGRCNLADVWRTSWQHVIQTHNEPSVTLSETLTDVDTTCVADSHRMEQVFRNILENAVAASPSNGKVTLSCQAVELQGQPFVRVSIADEGAGLTPEQREHIFEPFYTTKQTGTGLGMAIAQRIIAAHGGQIRVCENEGGGAVIEVTLPRSVIERDADDS